MNISSWENQLSSTILGLLKVMYIIDFIFPMEHPPFREAIGNSFVIFLGGHLKQLPAMW